MKHVTKELFQNSGGCKVACIQRCRDRYHRHTLYGEPHSSQLVGELRCLGPRVLKEPLFHLGFCAVDMLALLADASFLMRILNLLDFLFCHWKPPLCTTARVSC